MGQGYWNTTLLSHRYYSTRTPPQLSLVNIRAFLKPSVQNVFCVTALSQQFLCYIHFLRRNRLKVYYEVILYPHPVLVMQRFITIFQSPFVLLQKAITEISKSHGDNIVMESKSLICLDHYTWELMTELMFTFPSWKHKEAWVIWKVKWLFFIVCMPFQTIAWKN